MKEYQLPFRSLSDTYYSWYWFLCFSFCLLQIFLRFFFLLSSILTLKKPLWGQASWAGYSNHAELLRSPRCQAERPFQAGLLTLCKCHLQRCAARDGAGRDNAALLESTHTRKKINHVLRRLIKEVGLWNARNAESWSADNICKPLQLQSTNISLAYPSAAAQLLMPVTVSALFSYIVKYTNHTTKGRKAS